MSKIAEEAALKAYPKEDGKVWHSTFGTFEFDKNAGTRKAYQEGYDQSAKDIIARIRKRNESKIAELESDKYITIDAKVCRVSELRYELNFLSTLEKEYE